MRQNHPFPNSNPKLFSIFQNDLCKAISPSDLGEIRSRLQAHMQELEEAQEELLGPNIMLATEIHSKFEELLLNYASFEKPARALIMGAINYFLAQRDLIPDHTPISGFDDDARILNYVLEQIGKSELCIADI